MKKKSRQTLILALLTFPFLFSGCASTQSDTSKPSPTLTQEEHEKHHPEEKTPVPQESSAEEMGQGVMGKMDMAQMMAMRDKCMEIHKDRKMCDGQMMEMCQAHMGGIDCSGMIGKMMEPMKERKEIKTKKKK